MSVIRIIECMVVKSVQSSPYQTNDYGLPSSGSKPHQTLKDYRGGTQNLYGIPQCERMQFQVFFLFFNQANAANSTI